MNKPKAKRAPDISQEFVRFIIKVCAHKGNRAKLKRGDHTLTQMETWPFLVRFIHSKKALDGQNNDVDQINLESETQRNAYALIASMIAKTVNYEVDKSQSEFSKEFIERFSQGSLSLGAALAISDEKKAFDLDSDHESHSPQQARLRRLLACQSAAELCQQLRPVLSLLLTRVIRHGKILNFAQLLDDLLYFDSEESQLKSKARWTQDFYRTPHSLTQGDSE